MAANLYVGNLSYNVTSSDLEKLFSQFGTVKSAQVVSDKFSGRSKGFGFVEMQADADAQAAITGLNLKEHDGRCMTVNEARPRESRSGGGGRSRSGGRGGRRDNRY
ncbi:MAG TPA: RNA-binding protein [Planctomycetaceae bacterium]|nr:RNA-binding protein [Planctomycetaceae bacterium]